MIYGLPILSSGLRAEGTYAQWFPFLDAWTLSFLGSEHRGLNGDRQRPKLGVEAVSSLVVGAHRPLFYGI